MRFWKIDFLQIFENFKFKFFSYVADLVESFFCCSNRRMNYSSEIKKKFRK